MLTLTKEDKEILKHLGYPKIIKLSCGAFLAKIVSKKEAPNELIGERLAHVFGLKYPKYHLIKIDNEYYCLSEDLNQEGVFVPASTMISLNSPYSYKNITLEDVTEPLEPKLYSNNIYDIWTCFAAIYDFKTTKKLIIDILKIYIFDLLFCNYDRREDNWGIISKNNTPIIVMFDNEYLFSTVDFTSLFIEKNAITESRLYFEFRAFLNESSSEFLDLFTYYYDFITPEFLNSILNEVNKECGLIKKDTILSRYQKRRQELLKIYQKHKEENYAR